MRRIRRITMEIIHRRQQVTLNAAGALNAAEPATAAAGTADPAKQAGPAGQTATCPVCGAPWVLVHDPESGAAVTSLPDLNAAFASLDLHLQSTPAGQLWLCRRSLDRFKENR